MRFKTTPTKQKMSWWHRIVILGLMIINLILLRSSWRASHQEERVRDEEVKTEALREQVATMQKRLVAYKTGILEESAIRDSLGYAKPSETIVILPELPSDSTQAAVLSLQTSEPIWKQWLTVLLGW